MKSVGISFIRDWAPKTSQIGIVDFDSSSTTLAYLTSIETQSSRDYLIDRMSDSSFVASGGTNIDGGIWKGIEVKLKCLHLYVVAYLQCF